MADLSPEKLAQLWPSELSTILPSQEARAELPNIALDGRYDAPARRLAIYVASDEQLCIKALKSDSIAARAAAINSFAQIMGKKSRRPAAWKAIGGTDGFVELVHRLSFREASNLAMAISKRCKKSPESEDANEELDDAVRRLLKTPGDTSRLLFPHLWPLLSATSADVVREVLPTMITLMPAKLYRLSYTHPNTIRTACLSYINAVSTDEEKVEDIACFRKCLEDLILSCAPFDHPGAGESQQSHPGLRFALALLRAYASLIERVPNLASSKDLLAPRSDNLIEIGALCFNKVGPHDVPALEEFAQAITKICRLSNIKALFQGWRIASTANNFLRTPIRAWSLDPNERTSSLLTSLAFHTPSESYAPIHTSSETFLDQVPKPQRFALLRILCSSTSSPLEIDADEWSPTDDPGLQRSRAISWDPTVLLTFDRARALKAYQASVSVLGSRDALRSGRTYYSSDGRGYRKIVFEGFKSDVEGGIMGAYLRGDVSIIKQLKMLTVKESVAEERAKFLKLTLHAAALFDGEELFKDTLAWAFERFAKDLRPRETITSSVLASRLCIEAIAGVGDRWRVTKAMLDSPEKFELLTRRYERGNDILRLIVAALHKAVSEPDFSTTEWHNLYTLISEVFCSRTRAFERLGFPQALLSKCLESVLDIRLEAERIALLQASAKLTRPNRQPFNLSFDGLAIGRRSAPMLLAVLDAFSEKRDNLYEEARITKRAAVAALPAGVPRGLPIQDLVINISTAATWTRRGRFYTAVTQTTGHRSPFIEARLHDILFSPYEVLQAKITMEQEEYCTHYIDSFDSALEAWLRSTDGTAASIDRFTTLAKHLRHVSPDGDLRGLLLAHSSSDRWLQYEKVVRDSFGDAWPQIPGGGEEWNPLVHWPADPYKNKLLVEGQTLLAKRAEPALDRRAHRTQDLFAMARKCRTALPGRVRKAIALVALNCLKQLEPFNAHLSPERFTVADLTHALHSDFLDEAKTDNLKLRHITSYVADVSSDVDPAPLLEFASIVTQEQHIAQVLSSSEAADMGQALDLVVHICKALQLSDNPQLAIQPSLDAIKDPEVSSRARHMLGSRILRILRPAQVELLYEQLFDWIAAKRASKDFDIKVSVLKMVTEMLRLPYLSRSATFSRFTQLGELTRHIDVQHGICKWILEDLVKSSGSISDAAWSLVDSFVTMANGIAESTSFTEEKWHEFESGATELPEVDSDQRIRTLLLRQSPEDLVPDLRREYAERVIARLALNATTNKRRYVSAFLRASGIKLETLPRVAQGVSVMDVENWIPWLPLSLLEVFESEATVHLLDTQFTQWKLDLSRHNLLWNDAPAGKEFSRINQSLKETTIARQLVSALLKSELGSRSDKHTISIESLQDLLASVGIKLLQNPRSILSHHPLMHIRAYLTALEPPFGWSTEAQLWPTRVRPVFERIAAAYDSLVLESGPAIKPHRLEFATRLLPFPNQPPFSGKTDSHGIFARALADLIASLIDEDIYHVHLPPLMALAGQKKYFMVQDIIPTARALTSISDGNLRARVIRHEWASKLIAEWSQSLTGDSSIKKMELVETWRQDESPLVSALSYDHLSSGRDSWSADWR
ncbi:hypothetical protein BOTBODRAFT_168958 [Botryobasidium botryosum FD-172 SS1]|uniref:Uncharacterized protein n=1 Tax=Botryobasidium botryosum (strain FD-172 SS1) TaxID=930990 RepID=A0A067NC95_BOTB1|nr:hypothetical protein BOTBODRAFT_168958 [Botryobasidium botryosum FD-172 SS1]